MIAYGCLTEGTYFVYWRVWFIDDWPLKYAARVLRVDVSLRGRIITVDNPLGFPQHISKQALLLGPLELLIIFGGKTMDRKKADDTIRKLVDEVEERTWTW